MAKEEEGRKRNKKAGERHRGRVDRRREAKRAIVGREGAGKVACSIEWARELRLLVRMWANPTLCVEFSWRPMLNATFSVSFTLSFAGPSVSSSQLKL